MGEWGLELDADNLGQGAARLRLRCGVHGGVDVGVEAAGQQEGMRPRGDRAGHGSRGADATRAWGRQLRCRKGGALEMEEFEAGEGCEGRQERAAAHAVDAVVPALSHGSREVRPCGSG